MLGCFVPDPVEMIDGARWQAFWWYTAGSGWPADQTDVLGGDLCVLSSNFIF